MEFETLQTERLILRKLTPEHYKWIFGHHTKEEAKVILGLESDKEYETRKFKSDGGYTSYNRSMLQFQMIEKSTGTTVALGGFHNWYADHKRAELGYVMEKEEYKRKGIMSEALQTIIPYGFNVMGLHRIEAFVGTQNIPSQRLLEKNGFRREGVLRDHWLVNDTFEDSLVFSLLKEEFEHHPVK